MGWLRAIDEWFIVEVLPHRAAYRARSAYFCGPEEADDLVQEAYARVLETPDYRNILSPRSFVLKIVHNLALERLRRSNVVRLEFLASLEVLDAIDPAPDAFDVTAARSEWQQLLRLIDALPPQCARVMRMRKIQGMTPAAIAGKLSISISTVEKHLAKGLALIVKARREADERVEEDCPTVPKPRPLRMT